MPESCNVSCLAFKRDVVRNLTLCDDCPQFCDDFASVQHVYLAFSVLSSLSCFLVFLTYGLLPRLRHGGHSSIVFIYRQVQLYAPAFLSGLPCV